MIDKLATQQIDTQMRAAHGIINTHLRRDAKPDKQSIFQPGERSNVVKKTVKRLDSLAISKQYVPTIALYSKVAIQKALRRSRKQEHIDELKLLAHEEALKPLAVIQNDTITKLDELAMKFPNFNEVVERYRQSLILQSLGGNAPIWFPPTLLVGPPGVGKTRFLSELGKVMKTGFYSVDMTTVTSGFVLSGNSSAWADSKAGFVSNSLRDSKVANPILLIDEMDKASGEARYNPIGCLYALLEKHTAKRFVDEFLEIPLDCSHINWIASANYEMQIPDPIKSRMDIITIEPPEKDCCAAIVLNIYRELLEDESLWGQYFSCELNDDVLSQFGRVAPRDIRKTLRKACGHAVARAGKGSEWFELSVIDIKLPKTTPNKTIGFL
jgi:ATP-dependent Lon protease